MSIEQRADKFAADFISTTLPASDIGTQVFVARELGGKVADFTRFQPTEHEAVLRELVEAVLYLLNAGNDAAEMKGFDDLEAALAKAQELLESQKSEVEDGKRTN